MKKLSKKQIQKIVDDHWNACNNDFSEMILVKNRWVVKSQAEWLLQQLDLEEKNI